MGLTLHPLSSGTGDARLDWGSARLLPDPPARAELAGARSNPPDLCPLTGHRLIIKACPVGTFLFIFALGAWPEGEPEDKPVGQAEGGSAASLRQPGNPGSQLET